MTMVTILSTGLACAALLLPIIDVAAEEDNMTATTDSTRTLFASQGEEELSQWLAVNDGVMGGLSQGKASLTEDSCLLFDGTISLENNGGFASIRTVLAEFDLGDYKGVRLRVKGDGRKYQFRIRTDERFDGIAFKLDFQTTKDTWMEIDLPFASFLPTYRGRILNDTPPLAAGEIRQLGFLIADKNAGPFKLIVDRIEAFK